MNSISSQQSFAPFSHSPFTGGRSMQVAQTRAGALSVDRSTDLTITTNDGDTVTLSLESAVEAKAGVYSSQSASDGYRASTRTAYFEYSSDQSMSITVEGELSEEELADIREAVSAIGGMIEDFMSGDLKAMAADGKLLEELDSISSLEATFAYERQVTYGEQETVQLSTTARDGRPGRGHGRMRHLMNRIDQLTDRMADRVAEFGSHREQIARSVNGLLRRYGLGETENPAADRLNREVVQTVQSVFVQKMETLTESADFTLTYNA